MDPAAAEKNELRIAHLHQIDPAAGTDVDDREGGVADVAVAADREGVHHDFRRVDDLPFRGGEFQCHGGGHGGKDVGFDAVAHAVGEDGKKTALFRNAAELQDIAADAFVKMGALAAAGVDEQGIGGLSHFPKCSIASRCLRVSLSA